MIVRELAVRLGFQLNNAQVQNAERATSRLKQQADQAAQSFRNIVAAMAGFASVRALVTLADSMQNLESRVGMLPQTVGDVGEAFEEMGKHARETRTPLEAYGTLYVRLGNAGKDYIKTQKELLGITDTVANSLVVGGASAAEAGSVMLQFSQAIGSGVMQGGEFNAMAEAAPQFMDHLAVAIGYPREQLKKMAADGQLTSKKVIEGVKKMQDYFERRAKQMPMTIGQAAEDVKTRFSLMIASMNRESGLVTKVAEKIISAFDAVEKSVKFLVKSFEGWNNILRVLGVTIGVVLAYLYGQQMIAFVAMISVAAIKFALIAAAVLLVVALIDSLIVYLQGGDSIIGDMLEKFSQWAGAISTAIDDGLAYAENAVLETIKGWSDALYRMFVETIPKAIRDAWNAVTGLPGNIIDSIKSGASALTGGGAAFGVTPSSVATATGNRTVVSNNTNNVSIQVPAGTGPEQVEFVKNGTQKYMDSLNKPMTTRDAMAYGG